MKSLFDYINDFGGKKIAVMGDVSLDEYLFGRVDRVNPERKAAYLLTATRNELRLGCAANVANNLSSLGVFPTLYGVVGKDIYSEKFRYLCEEKGIFFEGFEEGKTIVKQRIIEEEFEDYLGRIDYGENELKSISAQAREFFKDRIFNSSLDAILFSDYNKKFFTGNFSEEIIDLAKELGVFVAAAPKPENISRFKNSNLICLNLDEAGRATGIKGYENVKDSILRLKEITNSEKIVVTCGKYGMVSYDGNFHDSPTRVRELIDVTGAGDTVFATLTLSLLSGANLYHSTQIANYAAGIVVEKQGTATTTIEELIKRVDMG